MEENSGVRRSQRLLKNPPEVFATPLLGPPTIERAMNQQDGPTQTRATLISFSESSSVVTRKSGRLSNQSFCSNQSEVARLKLKAEIESLQRLGQAETQFLLAKQKFDIEKKVEEKRLKMEKLVIEEDFEEDDASFIQQDEQEHDVVVQDTDANVSKWLSEREPERVMEPGGTSSGSAVMVQVAQTNA
ncbi:unnamed protein product, partial [Allacma fusca]